MVTEVSPERFGRLPSGEAVDSYTLANALGTRITAINYGAIVTSINLLDGRGRPREIALGFSALAPYLGAHPYLGAIVGRVAGRIAGGRFRLDGQTYELARNEGPNHLHGGCRGFDKRLWHVGSLHPSGGESELRLAYRSPDGEEGYPGTVEVEVTYRLTPDDEFSVETEATCDRPTPLCLASHPYFNLSGEGSDGTADHWLQVHSDEYAPIGETGALLGHALPVDAANDFNRPRRMGDAVPRLAGRHGDHYFVRRPAGWSGQAVPACRLTEPSVGLGVEIRTNERCLQVYSGCGLDGSQVGRSGRRYGPFAGIALECQGCPSSLGAPELDNIILRPGEVRRRTTVHRFIRL